MHFAWVVKKPRTQHLASSGSTPSMDGNQLRLVDCPNCKCRLICIRSKQPETFNQLFFKCPNNGLVTLQGDPNTCGWIRSERQYEAYLRMMDERREKLKQHYGEIEDLAEARSTDLVCDLKEQFGQLKNQHEELKVQVDQALADIWDLKMHICEVKQQLYEGKKMWEMGWSVVPVVCVAALIGMLVTMVLK
ncbi:hypothetical protein PVAP13_6NG172300 [Panicum virgatum]|uniref:Uncharacterized protein n=1 Tax=Panicum virgatum TaxID=38727 RepID=A0A8T0QX09_PANVG|nr:hypothetical protein PVAP13_6NG172300 [Panicum virgatum]